MTKRAIVFGAHPWRGAFQLGAHHLARAAVNAGYDVLYVASPLSTPHLAGLFSERLRPRWRDAFRTVRENGVTAITPFTWTPLAARWGADNMQTLFNWPAYTTPRFNDVIRKNGFSNVDLALIDGPLQLSAARIANPKKLVMRVFDRFEEMPGTSPALLQLARIAAQEADLVVYSAAALEEAAISYGARRALFLPNGVNTEHFAAPHPAPAAYADIAAPRAVYVGQTGPLFDHELVARVATARPKISFVLIGPSDGLSHLDRYKNIYRLGPVPWTDLPGYLQHAHVGLIPFAVEKYPAYIGAVQPLKLYEYLASGIPVVSSYWTELERIAAPSVVLTDSDGFAAGLDQLLATRPQAWALKAFAEASSWNVRFRQLLSALE